MKHPLIISGTLALLAFAFYTSHSLYKHLSYNSHAFDLGIYTQISFLYSQALTPYSSLKHMLLLADHFGPILWLLSPLYALFPQASTLLIIQALFVALSSIPLYYICFHKTKSHLISSLLALSYLSSTAVLSAINFDFHLGTISVLPLSLMLFFWYFQKWWLYWLTLLFSLLFKEDIPLFIFGLGLFQLWQKQLTVGVKTISFSLIGFYLIKIKLMSLLWAGGGQSYLSNSLIPLDDPLTLVILLFTNPFIYTDQLFNSPQKINTLLSLHQPFAFFSILSPLGWLTAFPHLFLRFASTYTQSWTMDFHHNINLMPFLVTSSALALQKFHSLKRPIVLLLVFFLIIGPFSPKGFIWTKIFPDFSQLKHYDYISNSFQIIPPQAAVSSQTSLVPHLSNREKIYLFPEVIDAEYIVLDSSLGTYPMSLAELEAKIKTLRESKYWELQLQNNSLLLFRRKEI